MKTAIHMARGSAGAPARASRALLLAALLTPTQSQAGAACIDVWPGPDGSYVLRQRDDYRLTDREIRQLGDEAIRGSPDAALRLGRFYVLTVDPCSREGRYWLHVAVENGSPGGMYQLGRVLIESDDARDKARGVYWLRRALEDCDKPGRDLARMTLQHHGIEVESGDSAGAQAPHPGSSQPVEQAR